MRKLTRREAEAALQAVPMEAVLTMPTGERLTSRQREFARQIALGQSKAGAYRAAYRSAPTTKPKSQSEAGRRLSQHAAVEREIEAYRLAIEAEKHRTPAQLRALVVQQLVSHALDAECKPAQRLRALELLGKVTEVAAFTERRESVVAHVDVRERLLRTLEVLEVAPDDGASLLAELAGDAIAQVDDRTLCSVDAADPLAEDALVEPGADAAG